MCDCTRILFHTCAFMRCADYTLSKQTRNGDAMYYSCGTMHFHMCKDEVIVEQYSKVISGPQEGDKKRRDHGNLISGVDLDFKEKGMLFMQIT